MNIVEAFSTWVPDLPEDDFGPAWTHWAKPVLFASINGEVPMGFLKDEDLPALLAALKAPAAKCAVVVDLPGTQSISVGVELAEQGYRPVPLFNGSPGRDELISTSELISALRSAAARMQNFSIPADAPPVFLLDSRRMSKAVTPAPGKFDNRWFTFPQDFPSANLLRARGISTVLLIQEAIGQPAEDLSHVLKRWQDAGMEILGTTPDAGRTEPLKVNRPRRFRSLAYGLLALIGLFPNSAGGFGGIIPHPSSG